MKFATCVIFTTSVYLRKNPLACRYTMRNNLFYSSNFVQVQRLPCLHSSNLMSNLLTGKLDTIDAEDVLNGNSFSKVYKVIHFSTWVTIP